MFALRVRYLRGQVCAAEFDDGDGKRSVEWPPHPSRLFSALVSAWAEGGAEPELREVLSWLEKQPNPSIHYQEHNPRQLVNVFVPVNDSHGAEALPEERPRKGRTFPTAHLAVPEVWFIWPNQIPEQFQSPMESLLRRTPSIGHSSSIVGIEMGSTAPVGMERLEPRDGPGARRVRVIGPGRLESLERSYERFERTASKVHRPSRGSTALYSPPARESEPRVCGTFRDMVVLRRVSGERTGLLGTLALTSALRGALMDKGPQPSPEILSGHSPHSSNERPLRSERPHVALAPLPFVGSRHATGDIGGLAVVLPAELTDEERDDALQACSEIRELKMAFGRWTVVLSNAEETRSNLLPQTWTGMSRTWASVTPYVFDRYPSDLYSQDARDTVAQSFERVGLPRPSAVSLMKTSVIPGVPPSPAFSAAPGRPGKPQRFHMHVLVTFDELVEGPVLAGAGRYYGYGLFRPFREEGGR
jgi:CRISPR-associated protein Csb2